MNSELDTCLRVLSAHPAVACVEVSRSPGRHDVILRVTPAPSYAPAFGLFYFSDQDRPESNDDYRLYLEGAKRADALGLDAVWTPERHFTAVGAASPNPSVLSAALAMTTTKIALRAGSVVLPLHHPVRVAEEWAVVDRLSGGRVGVSFASGWVQDDFIFAPQAYANRRAATTQLLCQVRDLWAGKSLHYENGAGQLIDIRIRPVPAQLSIPIWLTAASSPDTFALAGKLGANVLSALLQLSIEQLAEYIQIYRNARTEANLDPDGGNVTVMMHTYLSKDDEVAVQLAQPALRSYFSAQTALRHSVAKEAGRRVGDNPQISDRLLDYSVSKFVGARCLIGSPASVQRLVQRLVEAGVNEVACLIDFGIPEERALDGIAEIAALKAIPYRRLERDLAEAAGVTSTAGCRVHVVGAWPDAGCSHPDSSPDSGLPEHDRRARSVRK